MGGGGLRGRRRGAEDAFGQRVIEDRFPQGRPDREAGGALFVRDVARYERTKLGMLDGAHSMPVRSGFPSGRGTVREEMGGPIPAALVCRHRAAAAATLDPMPGIDLRAHADDLTQRFADPGLAHDTHQIAIDGTERMPRRIFAPALDPVRAGRDVGAFAFATAAWMRRATGRRDDGSAHPLRDPRGAEVEARRAGAGSAEAIRATLSALPGPMSDELRRSAAFMVEVRARPTVMLGRGMAAAGER